MSFVSSSLPFRHDTSAFAYCRWWARLPVGRCSLRDKPCSIRPREPGASYCHVSYLASTSFISISMVPSTRPSITASCYHSHLFTSPRLPLHHPTRPPPPPPQHHHHQHQTYAPRAIRCSQSIQGHLGASRISDAGKLPLTGLRVVVFIHLLWCSSLYRHNDEEATVTTKSSIPIGSLNLLCDRRSSPKSWDGADHGEEG